MKAESGPHTISERLSVTSRADLTRRATLGHLVAGAVGLMGTMMPEAGAQATPTSSEDAPNHFVLTGAETEIAYDVPKTGRPQLRYVGPYGHHVLTDDQLRHEESVLGRLVTGSLGAFPDQGELWLTLLLPRFASMTSGDAPAPFTTIGILKWVTSTIAGPPQTGALEEYHVVTQQGIAQRI